MLRPHEEALIVFYFRAQSLFERSTFGDMLARSEASAFDSTGKRLPASTASWNWRPAGWHTEGGRLRLHDDAPTPLIPVHSQRGGEPGYEVDDEKLVRFAEASRRMLAVERRDPTAKRTLEAFYGDRGCKWAAFATGGGSIASVYLLTRTGQAFLDRERAKTAERARKGGGAELHLTDDDLLASVLTVQAVQPDRAKRARLAAVRDEAEGMLVRAWGAWLLTAGAGAARGRRATAPASADAVEVARW